MTATYSLHFRPANQSLLFLAILAFGTLGTGCFVLTGDRRNKADAAREQVNLHSDSVEMRFSRQFDSADFAMDVGAENGPIRWEAPFLFYNLPIPTSYDYLATQPLRVDVHLEPKFPRITIDPWQIFFLGPNRVRVPPTGIWQDKAWLGTNTVNAVSITKNTTFLLEFSPWDQVHPDRDLPFQLSIEGIQVSGQSISLLPMTFKPEKFIRAGFRLPY